MFQRLLSLVFVSLIYSAAFSQNVLSANDPDYIYDINAGHNNALGTNPDPVANGTVQKWVHDPSQKNRIGSWQSVFKSYRLSGYSFRLRFPKNYDPTAKYPLLLFLHGAGEACDAGNSRNANGTDRENQDQLYWGADSFSLKVDRGEFNGFLLFPQLYTGDANWEATRSMPVVNSFLDNMVLYNGLDPDRIIVMGLSAGGKGALNYSWNFPQRIATAIPSCPEGVENEKTGIPNMLEIPVWMGAGGTDGGPKPDNVFDWRDNFVSNGGNMYLTYYPTQGHGIWEQQWYTLDNNNTPILNAYLNSASKTQPVVYGRTTQFCTGQNISAKMGVTSGFTNYQWQKDNGSGFADIAGATSNTYTATSVGKYRVHYKRAGSATFSDWSPRPIVISTYNCADTAFVEHFESTPNTYFTVFGGGGNTGYYNSNNVGCQNSLFVNGTESFTLDAARNQGGRFMLSTTSPTCSYHAGDQVWRTMSNFTVASGTNYVLSYYVGNQSYYNMTSPSLTPLAQIFPNINDQTLTGASAASASSQGNVSWKKFSYIWNSGGSTSAGLSLKNNTTDPNGNDFAIDEISLVKYKDPAMPGGTFKNATLWAKANSIQGVNTNPVDVWNNDDFNGNAIIQASAPRMPLLKNNATDNINFNPVVAYSISNKQYNYAAGGYAGTTTHNAAHIYAVTKFSNVNTAQTVIHETQASGGFDFTSDATGAVGWSAGDIVTTAPGVNEANKPILWTLSRDNRAAGTPDGNKQDIRKNGVLSVAGAGVNTFTGNGSDLNVAIVNLGDPGTYNGTLAEVLILLDSTVTAAKENKIESYFGVKYGITLGSTTNTRNYTASDGTVFWTGNTTFQNDVFGIGKDSASALLQTISNSANSGSGDGTGQFAKGNLVLSTNATLKDKTFLMIGNDAGSLSEMPIAAGQAPTIAVGSTRLMRNWKVVNTGVVSVAPVDLSIDTTGLANLKGGTAFTQYALMIDNDGDNQFYNTSVIFSTATGVSGKKLLFSGVTLLNGAVFTLITNKLNAALPATWLGFTAEAVNGNALLNWKTSDEINVDQYVVEHSFNGVSFSAIGSVAAHNSSGVNNYTFTDFGLAAGTHYYRIRRVDKDGKSEYTDVKTVKITVSGANVQIRPNPVAGTTLMLAVSVPQNIKTYVQVMSADGKIMLKENLNLATGSNIVNLNIDFIPSGVYLLQIQLNDEVVTKKFIRQH